MCFGHIITRKEHANATIEFIMTILIQYQSKYIIIPGFRQKHLSIFRANINKQYTCANV